MDKPAQGPAEQPTKPVAEVVKPQDSEFNAAYEAEVVRLVNAERAKYGLAALIQDDGAQNVQRRLCSRFLTRGLTDAPALRRLRIWA